MQLLDRPPLVVGKGGSATTWLAIAPPPGDVRYVRADGVAWPKPAPYQLSGGPTDLNVPPKGTYPEVEKQVAAQVAHIAFFGMKKLPWFAALDSVVGRIAGSGIGTALLGGRPPSIFSTARMDSPERGPITTSPIPLPMTASVAAMSSGAIIRSIRWGGPLCTKAGDPV